MPTGSLGKAILPLYCFLGLLNDTPMVTQRRMGNYRSKYIRNCNGYDISFKGKANPTKYLRIDGSSSDWGAKYYTLTFGRNSAILHILFLHPALLSLNYNFLFRHAQKQFYSKRNASYGCMFRSKVIIIRPFQILQSAVVFYYSLQPHSAIQCIVIILTFLPA